MTRKAVVIVPKEEDYKARIEAQEKEETKDVPDTAVMEMKGDYPLPHSLHPKKLKFPEKMSDFRSVNLWPAAILSL